MAAAAAWKVHAREQAEQAGGRCDVARGLLAGANLDIEEALGDLVTRELVEARARARRAEDTIAKASDELAEAASLARAAELVALRGCAAPHPAAAPPRLSIKDIPDEGLRADLTKLWKAAKGFGSACDLACVSRGHLVGVLQLLDHPHPLPGAVEELVNVKLEDARHNLGDALRLVRKSADRLNGAIAALL